LTAHSHLYRGEAPPGTNVMHLYRVSRLIQMLHHICIGCFVSVQYPVQTRIMNRHKCRFSNSETISSCASSVTCQIGYVSLPLIFPFFHVIPSLRSLVRSVIPSLRSWLLAPGRGMPVLHAAAWPRKLGAATRTCWPLLDHSPFLLWLLVTSHHHFQISI
jgi:hypothetical protein